MATVIDSLLIELGLDTSKFNNAQKKSVEQLRKFDEQSSKTFKNTQTGARDLGEGFGKARDALISLGATLLTMRGFSALARDTTETNANIGRTAELFRMSATELSAWGGVLKSVGGTAEDFQSSMQGIQQGIANIQFGDTSILETLARLQALDAYDYQKRSIDIYKLADAIKRFSEIYGEQSAFTLAQAMGINRNFFMVLEQGAGSVRQLYDESYRLSGVNEKNVQQAEKLQKEWGDVSNAFDKAKNQIMDQLYPALTQLAKVTQFGLEKFVEWDQKQHGAATETLAFAASIGTLTAAMKVLGVSAPKWFTKMLGTAGLALYSPALNAGEDEEMQRIREAEGITTGTSRNLRNKNPGNIKYGEFAKSHGAIGQEGPFAVFPDMETGKAAMNALLMSYMKGGNDTISSIINKWAPAGADNNNTEAYINSVSKQTGIDRNQKLSVMDLARVQEAMAYFEGHATGVSKDFKPKPLGTMPPPATGTFTAMPLGASTSPVGNVPIGAGTTVPVGAGGGMTNIQTTIGKIDVNTQATDANGIANDIGNSIKNNQIINSGLAGTH